MTMIEISQQVTESMLATIGKRIDLLTESYRNGMDRKEWYATKTGETNALDMAIDQMMKNGMIINRDYNKLDDAMDRLADLEYGGEK